MSNHPSCFTVPGGSSIPPRTTASPTAPSIELMILLFRPDLVGMMPATVACPNDADSLSSGSIEAGVSTDFCICGKGSNCVTSEAPAPDPPLPDVDIVLDTALGLAILAPLIASIAS